jgi:conjugative transfer signal peptidase TraF
MLHIRQIVAGMTRYLSLYLRSIVLLYVALLVTAGFLVELSHFVGINTSVSAAPVGLYLRTAPRPGRGKLVEVCLPSEVARFGIERSYIGRSWRCPDGSEPVGKRIVGMPGDFVDIDPATVLRADTAGRLLHHFPFGKHRLKAGEIWLAGSARNSWDSRYYGGVPIANVQANLTPLLTW